MKFETIKVNVTAEKIGIISLNRPEKRNAISIQMRLDISKCLQEWNDSNDIILVIITGEGTTFSAGFDLKEFSQQEKLKEIFSTSSKYHRDIWYFPKPVIAAVNGPAMGGGFDLSTLCDIRICSEDASFGHPEIKFGAPPLYTPLRWITGNGIARDLCLTGRKIDAEEAYRIGLVSRICTAPSLLENAVEIARTILEAPAETLQIVKKYLIGNSALGFEESFIIEHDEPFLKAFSR